MYSYELDRLVANGVVKKVLKLPRNPLYLKDEIYWCGYWHKYYKVLDAHYTPVMGLNHKVIFVLKEVTVKWADGKISAHCTQLNPLRDYRLILDKNLGGLI